MTRLLIIADDVTGALDTGVQFASYGASVRVLTIPDADLTAFPAYEVLVVNAETRHLTAQQAYSVVEHIVTQAMKADIPYIYKKTDSALRGNIGAELTALLNTSGEKQLAFLPAFPQIGRTTIQGAHYIEGVPVARSVFGKDPFEPVSHSRIPDLIAEQSRVEVHCSPALCDGQDIPAEEGIIVFDAASKTDLEQTGQRLLEAGKLKIMAGCAGFAAVLPSLIGLEQDHFVKIPTLEEQLLVICGSVNPITIAQLDNAEQNGFYRIRLTPEQKLDKDHWLSAQGRAEFEEIRRRLEEDPCRIIDTNDAGGNQATADYAAKKGMTISDIRVAVAQSVGYLVNSLFSEPTLGTLLITGGDTLLQCMNYLGVHELQPLCELYPGVVLSDFTYQGITRHVISKSGGFGTEKMLSKIVNKLRETQNRKEVNHVQYMQLPGLTTDGKIYYDPGMGTLEALLPTGDYPTCHAPALLELPGGDMLCVWFAGTYEGSADIRIICSRLPAGSDTWSQPVDVSGDPERSEQNPSLFLGPDGAAWCMYTAQLDRQAGKDNMQYTAVVRCQKSFDGGKTWGEYETIFPEEGTFCRQPIQILSNGRWIFGNWICTDSPDGLLGDPTAFRISDDQGKTWRKVMMPESNGRVHANVVELEPGHLAAFMRSRDADFIYRSESHDYGETWTKPVPTPLPNNNSSISALKLASGRIAIAYNPTSTPAPEPGKAAWPGLRCPVAVALSEDGGLTFPFVRWMERGEGFMGEENRTNNKQYEYPYLMQGADGMLTLVYAALTRKCVKMVRFSEEDVMGQKREKVGLYNPTAAQSR